MIRALGFLATAVALYSIVIQLGELAVPALLGMDAPSADVLADRARYASYTARQPVSAHFGRLVVHVLGGIVAAFAAASGRLSRTWILATAAAAGVAAVGLGVLRPGTPAWVRAVEPAAAVAGVYLGYVWIETTRRRVRGDL